MLYRIQPSRIHTASIFYTLDMTTANLSEFKRASISLARNNAGNHGDHSVRLQKVCDSDA